MHKYLSLLFAACLLMACNSKPSVADQQKTPEDAAKGFFQALSAKDHETAAAFGTELTQKQLRLFVSDMKIGMGSEEDRAAREKSLQLDLKSVNCKETDGSMICKICCNAEGAEAEVEMQQVEGKWFVQLDLGYKE